MSGSHDNIDFNDWERQSSEEVKRLLNGIRENPCPEESVQRALKAANEIGMTTSAWNRGLAIGLRWGIPLFVVVNGVAFWVISQIGFDGNRVLLLAPIFSLVVFVSIGILFGIHMLIHSLRDYKKAGVLLVDCGPHPGRNWHLVQPLILTTLSVVSAMVLPYWGTLGLIGITVLVWLHSILMMRSRLLFCENGIWRHWNLLPWDQIKSHQWENGPTLLIRTGWTTSIVTREALPIPAELQSQVAELLIEHVRLN